MAGLVFIFKIGFMNAAIHSGTVDARQLLSESMHESS